MVTVSASEWTALVLDAETYRALCRSPHITDLLAEWHEWWNRTRDAESHHGIALLSAAMTHGPTYAELDRRRREVAPWPPNQASPTTPPLPSAKPVPTPHSTA